MNSFVKKSSIQFSSSPCQSIQFDRLLQFHSDELSQFIRRKLQGNPIGHVDEEDILHDTLVRALESPRRQEIRRPIAWLKTIANNLLRDRFKKISSLQRNLGRDCSMLDPSHPLLALIADSEFLTPSYSFSLNELIDAINCAIEMLPNEQKIAVQIQCLEQCSPAETAQRMNRSQASVRGLVQRAKQSLRKSLLYSALNPSKRRFNLQSFN